MTTTTTSKQHFIKNPKKLVHIFIPHQRTMKRNILKIIHFFCFCYSLQGLPSCPVSLEVLRSHLPYLGYCLNFSDDKGEPRTDDDNTFTNNNNNNNLYGNQKDQFAPNLTPLHRFYREQQQRKKMPGFRGRRGLCGCFQVSETTTTTPPRNMKY